MIIIKYLKNKMLFIYNYFRFTKNFYYQIILYANKILYFKIKIVFIILNLVDLV